MKLTQRMLYGIKQQQDQQIQLSHSTCVSCGGEHLRSNYHLENSKFPKYGKLEYIVKMCHSATAAVYNKNQHQQEERASGHSSRHTF